MSDDLVTLCCVAALQCTQSVDQRSIARTYLKLWRSIGVLVYWTSRNLVSQYKSIKNTPLLLIHLLFPPPALNIMDSHSVCTVVASAVILLLSEFRFTLGELSNLVTVDRDFYLFILCISLHCDQMSLLLKAIFSLPQTALGDIVHDGQLFGYHFHLHYHFHDKTCPLGKFIHFVSFFPLHHRKSICTI